MLFLATVAAILLCGGCVMTVPSESEVPLRTPVASEATQMSGLRQEQGGASPTASGAGESALPTIAPSCTTPVATATSAALPSATTSATAPHETAVGGGAGPVPQSCDMVAEGEVTVYQRSSAAATVFGSMPAGSRVTVEGRTGDGWLGFDPGVAQAANVGVFRLRWIHESSAIRLEGPCDGLAKLVGPPPGFCFAMSMDEVQLYAEPDVSSKVRATMVPGDYGAVSGMTKDGWAKVDLSVGNTGLHLSGWIQGATLNLNGPCDDLPTIEP